MMFLLQAKEVLGYTPDKTLESSYAFIYALISEHYYLKKEVENNTDEEDEHGEFEWIELPSFDDPSKTIRMKKYQDIQGVINTSG